MTLTLEDIWSQFATRLRFFIRRRVADDASTDDILQNVFVKIQQRLESLRSAAKLEAWVHQIARNAIVDHFRTRRPEEPLPEDLALATEDRPGDEAERAALLEAFRRMITQLPEPYRTAIQLSEIDGIRQRELATRLGISLSGAKSRVHRGRAMLKDMLLDCCRFEFDRRGGILDCEPRKRTTCEECGGD